MIYIYNPKSWQAPRDLAIALRELGAEAIATKKAVLLGRPGAFVVNWGFRNPSNVGLNARILGNKLLELQKMKEGGVNVVEVSLTPQPGWLARLRRHKSGNDLMRNLTVGDFYVKKIEDVEQEFRIHIFQGKSIRAGVKKAKPDENPHPWIRSVDHGWWLDYGEALPEQHIKKLRHMAKKAIKALGYDFGAVDIGIRTGSKTVVFEVNTAPGLSTKATALAYAKHIKELVTGV